MRPMNRLFLFILIIFLLFGTVPAAFGQDTQEPVDIFFSSTGSIVSCGDQVVDAVLALPDTMVDYYQIELVSGQQLKVDVDAQAIGSDLDYILQLFDNTGTPLADGDDNLDDEVAPFDPSLEHTASATEVGPYIVAVSINLLDPEVIPEVPDSYQITFECTEVKPVSELQPGDLLASIGPSDASLISVDHETGIITDVRGPLGQFGQVGDIDFRDDGVLFGAAVDAIDDRLVGNIITVDPNSGEETWVGTLESGYVTALEFGGNPVTLYGIYQASENAASQLGTIDQGTGTFTFVEPGGVIDGYKNVDALAYDSGTDTMYGVGPGSAGIDLLTIDLATAEAQTVGFTGLKITISAIEFGPDGKLYGVTAPFRSSDKGTLVTIDTSSGTATEVVAVGGTEASTDALAPVSTSSTVSGLAFFPGWEESPPNSTTITSLDNNPFMGRLIDKFKFEGVQGESVKITVENLDREPEDALPPEDEKEKPRKIKSKWKWKKNNLLAARNLRGRAFLSLRDAMDGVHLRARDKGHMTLTIEEVLPATGLYYIILMQPVPRSLRVEYALTMTSSKDAATTLKATRLIEPRKCAHGENKETTDNTEQNGTVSTVLTTSLTSTSKSTSITSAGEGDDTQVGLTADGGGDTVVTETVEVLPQQPVAETLVVQDPVDDTGTVETQTADDAVSGGDTPDESADAAGDTAVEKPVVEAVDEPVIETSEEGNSAADDGGEADSGDDGSDEVDDDTVDDGYSDAPMEDPHHKG